ncbi:LysR family transcriptional regulator [Sphingomonas sp. R86520]|uniref:LysR family transcriptional regulator n=1 Tax=Sphingomonas sp. R86520 TaxID=3093859 RepID=UPI0036D2E4AD
MDRFEAMGLLIETVEAGSMSAAGRKLGVPLPTLSRKLADLEEHLGVRLLIRSTRRLELTEEGATYLAASRRILEEVGEAERQAGGEYVTPRGTLLVTAPVSFGRRHVLPIIGDYLAEHPEVSVRLNLSDQHLDLVGDHVDLAVRIGVLPDSQLVARRIGDMRWVIVGSPALLDVHGVPTQPQDLQRWPCVGVDNIQLASWWRFRKPGDRSDHTVAVRPRFAVNSGEGAVDGAVAGLGLTQTMLYQAAPAIADGRLRIVLADWEAAPLPLSIVYTGQGRMPMKTRSLLDFASPRLAADLVRLDRMVPDRTA